MLIVISSEIFLKDIPPTIFSVKMVRVSFIPLDR